MAASTTRPSVADGAELSEGSDLVAGGSARHTLALLAAVNLFNFCDRQIVSILGQSIKADLHLDDAELGFLLGTGFAVFYAVVGVAMGGISDRLSRKKVLAFGIGLWSLMTALGGSAASFAVLALARIGVGVGEAVAHPCSHSLLADLFPQRQRARAMAVYQVGGFVGVALAMFFGGYMLGHWHSLCRALPLTDACALAGWKAVLFAVGLPGLPLALALLYIREPARRTHGSANTAMVIFGEFATALPPVTLLTVHRLGGMAALVRNLAVAAAIAAPAFFVYRATGDLAQWASFGTGVYAVLTWGQIQSLRDRPLFRLTFGDPTFATAMIGGALVACVSGAVSAWTAPFAMRTYALSPAEVGFLLGMVQVTGSVLGVLAGGWLADRWKLTDLRAPLGVIAIAAVGLLPVVPVLLLVHNIGVFVAASFAISVLSSLWSGANAAMIQDLVLPRMRGAAAACHSLVAIVLASGLGPYWAGKVSVHTGSLATGLLSMLGLLPIALAIIWMAARRLRFETPEARLARAVAAGEPPEPLRCEPSPR